MATLECLFANNANSTLAGSINNTALTANLSAGTGVLFPAPAAGQFFKLTFIDAATGLINEIVHVTNVTVDTITMIRGQEGTTAKSWSAGDLAQNLMTAGTAALFAQPLDLQLQSGNFAVDSGTANALVVTLNPIPSALTAGITLRIKKSASGNTGAATLNVNGLGAVNLTHANGTNVVSGELPANGTFTAVYDGTSFVMQSTAAGSGGFLQTANNLSELSGTASTARTNLGLGSASVQNAGSSGHNLPFLDGSNTWSSNQLLDTTFNGALLWQVQNNSNGTSAQGGFSIINDASHVANFLVFGSGYSGSLFGSTIANAAVLYTQSSPASALLIGTTGNASLVLGTNNTAQLNIANTGGVTLGSPTGGSQGTGTLNATGLYVQGTVLGNAAFKTPSNNSDSTLASVTGSITANHFASFADTSGSVQDSGFNSSSFLKPSNNLSDVNNAATALANLGVSFATISLGTPTASAALSAAHGLGSTPFMAYFYIHCDTNSNGYTAGQCIHVNFGGGSVNDGGTGFWDASNVYFTVQTNGLSVHGGTPITAANFTLKAAVFTL